MFAQIMDFIKQYGATFALFFTWIGILWVAIRKRRDWHRKEFIGQVNFSLNYLQDGYLAMRTLLETSAMDVWLNDLGVKKVKQAAQRTTDKQPFIRLDDPEDMSFIYRAVLNVVSEKFSDVYLAQTLGLPVKTEKYRFAITFERYDDMRTLKLRVIFIKEEDLRTFFGEMMGGPKVQIPKKTYEARYKTLQAMHEQFLKLNQPDANALPMGRVELGLVV